MAGVASGAEVREYVWVGFRHCPSEEFLAHLRTEGF